MQLCDKASTEGNSRGSPEGGTLLALLRKPRLLACRPVKAGREKWRDRLVSSRHARVGEVHGEGYVSGVSSNMFYGGDS